MLNIKMHVRTESECAHLGVDPGVIIQAVSPEVDAQRVDGGVEITVTDYRHTETVMVQDGERGDPGTDGVSPTISVTDIPGGHRVTITDATGPHSFDVMDGDVSEAPVQSVNGQTGAVVLDAADVGAGTYSKPAGGIPASDLAAGVIPTVPVQDVQVNGASVLNNGVANVPVASSSAPGVVEVDPANTGISFAQTIVDGQLVTTQKICIIPASNGQIKSQSGAYAPVTADKINRAAFYGLAKAAGDTTQSASSNAVGAYTDSAKSAIHEMLNGSVSVSGSTPTITALPGIRYICGEVATLDITLPASGVVDVVFESGSAATVLTVTPPTGVTLKWANSFDPASLDANTTYEINIADGLGVAASWT